MLAPGEGFYIGLYVDTDSDEVFGGYELRLTFHDSLGYRYEEIFPVSVKQFDPQADGKACVATHAVAAPLLIDGTERFKTAGLCDSLVDYLGDDERENQMALSTRCKVFCLHSKKLTCRLITYK